MIWIDVDTPKYSHFFAKLMPGLKALGYDFLVTTRYNAGYTEAKRILDFYGIDSVIVGRYGGASVEDKFRARLARQEEFLRVFAERGRPAVLLSGSAPDSIQAAFGLGLPVINFCDTPLRAPVFSYDDVTIVSRLTLPLSSLVFYPFVIPREIFSHLCVGEDRLREYGFIDVCLWMDGIVADPARDFRKKYGLDPAKPTVLVREEEYKAHYVKTKLSVIYDLTRKIACEMDVNVVIMPRYEVEPLKREFADIAFVLEDKLPPEDYYPFIDLLVGGGGTMNLEAACYGIPTLSTRSLWLYHDKYLMDNGLMFWTDNADNGLSLARQMIGKKSDNRRFFRKTGASEADIVAQIDGFLRSAVS